MNNNLCFFISRLSCNRQTVTSVFVLTLIAGSSLAASRGGDSDGDGIPDSFDNCIEVANPAQRESDGDGFGNRCDADLDQSCSVNFFDLGALKQAFFSSDEDADFDGDGNVNFVDLGVMKSFFFGGPGPSALPNACSPVTLTLQGQIANGLLPLADIFVRIDDSAAAGDVTEIAAIAAMDGSYSIEIVAPGTLSFITVTATGRGSLDFVELVSVVGSAGSLLDQAVNGTVTSAEVSALNITPFSTVGAVLAENVHGEPINTDAARASATSGIDSGAFVQQAGVIQALMESAEISLPTGVQSTLGLLRNAATLADFTRDLERNNAELLAQAITAAIAQNHDSYDPEDIPAALYFTLIGNTGVRPGRIVSFTSASDGNYSVLMGSSPTAWMIDVEGRIVVDLLDPPTAEFFQTLKSCDGMGFQVRVNLLVEQVTITRVQDNLIADQVFVTERTRRTHPDDLCIPDVVTETEPGIPTARIAFGQEHVQSWSEDELLTAGLTVTVINRDANSPSVRDPAVGADTLDFNVDGTGSARRLAMAFDWSIEQDGALSLDFANGDRNTFTLLTREGQIFNSVVLAALGDGRTMADRALGIRRDEALELVPDNLKYRSAFSYNTVQFLVDRFDFNFLPGGIGCRDAGNNFSVPLSFITSRSAFEWETLGGRVDLRRFFDPATLLEFRSWEPIRLDGDHFWVIENLEFNDFAKPGYQPRDPATTPGRMNFYDIVRDISENAPPLPENDMAITSAQSSVIIDLLANDSDPDGDAVIVVAFDAVSQMGGTIQDQYHPTTFAFIGVQYTPGAAFVGQDTFGYTVQDGTCGDLVQAVVSVQVEP